MDLYGLQRDIIKRECYTCKFEDTCKCRTLEEDIPCRYLVKPEAKRIVRRIKSLYP